MRALVLALAFAGMSPALAQNGSDGSGAPSRLGPMELDPVPAPAPAGEDGESARDRADDAPAAGDGETDGDGAQAAPGDAATDTASGGSGSGGNASPGNGAPGEASTGNGASGRADPEGIEIDRLGKLDASTLGILDPDAGGLGPDMWRETPRRVVASLLPRMPAELDAPALRALARRLLLSSSAPPKRRQTPESDAPSLLRLRLDRLMAMGHYSDVVALLRVVPRRDQTPALRRTRVTAAFMAGETEQACRIVDAMAGRADRVFWQEALAVCQLARGQAQQAGLTVSLMREMADRPSRFLAVYDAVRAEAPLPGPPYPPMARALLLTGDRALPASLATGGTDPGLAAAVARHAATPARRRVAAAERAVAADLLRPAELRRLYRAIEFPDSLVTAARERRLVLAPPAAGALAPAERRALHFEAAVRASSPARRARILAAVFRAVPDDRYAGVVRAFVPLLLQDGPRPELTWFAGTAGRALYAAGRADAATEWLKLAREEAVITPDAATALTALWPYARMSGAAAVPMNGGLAAWRGAQPADGARLALQEGLLRAAFQALQEGDPRTWLAMTADAPAQPRSVPSADLIYALQQAGMGARVGEVALLAVIALGETGLAQVHPVTLNTALTALRQVGLTDTARRLAVEAALANGV